MLKNMLNKRGAWFVLALVLTAVVWAAEPAPFIVQNSTGAALWFVDSNGIQGDANGSRTTAQGVNNGFITGTGATQYAVLFKNANGTAVTLADTNYAVYPTLECSSTASPTALGVRSKTMSGFTLESFDALTSNHTVRWSIRRY